VRGRENFGRKKSRNHSRGSEGGPENKKHVFFPHPIVGAIVAFATAKDLMSMKQQVF
jgi:hypothetical protein